MMLDLLQIFSCGRLLATKPVNQISNGSSEAISGSTLRSWQHFAGSLAYKIPSSDSCCFTVWRGNAFTRFRRHSWVILSRKLVRIGEVVARLEKNDRHLRQMFPQQVEHDHVFGLEAAR